MWCNRMLVNGSTANFEQVQYLEFGFIGQAHFWIEYIEAKCKILDEIFGEIGYAAGS